jgi:5-methylcytosine-specific restriction endonuclease McrA
MSGRLTGVALTRVEDLVRARAAGLCERCGRGVMQADMHHRKLRSRGGPDSASNLVHICRRCHNWIHENPAAATTDGWMVGSHFDAEITRLDHCRYGAVYLADDGQVYGVIPTDCVRAERAAHLPGVHS